MNNNQFFVYLLILSLSTYMIRMIPFVAVKKKIRNKFIKSFLYYIPYAVLTVMTIPAMLYAPDYMAAACAGLILAVLLALKDKSLTTVAIISCLGVYIVETIIQLL